MINLIRAAWQEELRVPMFVGLSTDGYPLSGDPAMKNGARIYHMDTGKEWEYSADDDQWYQVPSASAVGSTEVTIGATPDSGAKIFIDTAAHFGDYLYNSGNEYPNITGGWENISGVVTKNDSNITVRGSKMQDDIYLVTANKIDLTNLDSIAVNMHGTQQLPSGVRTHVMIGSVKSASNLITVSSQGEGGNYILTGDVSSYSGEYFVFIHIWTYNTENYGAEIFSVSLTFNADTPTETLKYLTNGEYVAMDYARRADIEAIKDYVDELINNLQR